MSIIVSNSGNRTMLLPLDKQIFPRRINRRRNVAKARAKDYDVGKHPNPSHVFFSYISFNRILGSVSPPSFLFVELS